MSKSPIRELYVKNLRVFNGTADIVHGSVEAQSGEYVTCETYFERMAEAEALYAELEIALKQCREATGGKQ